MDIKLKAKLAAYSKMESMEILNTRVPHAAIDTLFDPAINPEAITHKDIDELFKGEEEDITVSKDKIDTLFSINNSEITKVSYADIDKLFN